MQKSPQSQTSVDFGVLLHVTAHSPDRRRRETSPNGGMR